MAVPPRSRIINTYEDAERMAAKLLRHYELSDVVEFSSFPDGDTETLIYLIQNELIEIPEHLIPE